jgi:hypothetical protein
MPYDPKIAVWFASNLSTLRRPATNTQRLGRNVHPAVPWALSFFNGAIVLGYVFGRTFLLLPGRTGITKGFIFGLLSWMVMGLLFFPALGLGIFATKTGLGVTPAFFSLLMLLTYSIVMGIAYSALGPDNVGEPKKDECPN